MYDEPPPQGSWFDELYSEGLVTDVLGPIKSGKEASVHLCRAGHRLGGGLLAAKVFHPRQSRNFKNDAIYKDGRVILNARTRRAVANKTSFGREADEFYWVAREWEAIELVHTAGADVPKPIHQSGKVILMEYLGNEDQSAPQLRDVPLDPTLARSLFDRLMWNVELFLVHNLIHADLSAYNILYWDGRASIIDFPQAVDARTNRNSRDLLGRDIENLCRHFGRHGVRADPGKAAQDLWNRFIFAKL
jgi:RIO kinase 1